MFDLKKPAVAIAAAACAATLVCAPAAADTKVRAKATEPVSVLVEGLSGPRQLSASGSRFYVAESDAGRVSVVDPITGGRKTSVSGVPLAQGVVKVDDKLYILVGEPNPDDGPSSTPGAAVMMAKPGQPAKKFADLLDYELKKNPDKQTQFGPDGKPVDALSNPYVVIRDRSKSGFLLVADAGGNDVLKVNKKGKISTLVVLPTVTTGACKDVENNNKSGRGCDPVPTGLAYGPKGLLYVSALTSEVPGEGRVYVVNPKKGKIVRTIKGLSGPTGVAVASNGTVYTSEVLEGAGPGDPAAFGQIVKTTPRGHRTYAQVTQPSGLVITDGKLYASAYAVAGFFGDPAGAGQVVRVRQAAFN